MRRGAAAVLPAAHALGARLGGEPRHRRAQRRGRAAALALEIGPVALVSPVSSTFAAITAALAIVAGERPTGAQLAGLALTALGVIGASIPPGGGRTQSQRGVLLAGLAALSWGFGFFALRFVVTALGPLFPVFVSRLVSVALLAAAALVLGQKLSPPRGAALFVTGIAVFDSAAFTFYNAGIATGLTSVVSILSSLFSAVTVLLALVFLRERLSALQWASVAVTLAGVGLVSSG